MSLSVLLAEKHHIVRKGLRSLIEAESDLTVIGETGDGLQAVDLAVKLQPDILIQAIQMPGLSGLDITRQVRQRSPNTRIVILTGYSHKHYIIEALLNGVHAYMLKDASPDELLFAIRQAARGKRFLSPSITNLVIESYIEHLRQEHPDDYDQLTDRERAVLHMAAEGLSNAEIASRLSIGERTVETHRANLMHKLNLKTQTDIVLYALRNGLIE